MTSLVSFTSCTRSMFAPRCSASTARARLPARRCSTGRPVITPSVDLRERPASTATPSDWNSSSRLSSLTLWARVHRNAVIRKLFQHRKNSPELLLLGHRLGARARRFAADVDDVGALLGDPARMRNGRFRIEEAAAVGEGVGRDVDHAHDEWLIERQREAAAPQVHAAGWGAVSPCAPPSLAGLEGVCEPEGFGGRGGFPDMMSPIW